MREGKYDQILKRMENVLDLSKECRFCGEDGIWVAQSKVIGSAKLPGMMVHRFCVGKAKKKGQEQWQKKWKLQRTKGCRGMKR